MTYCKLCKALPALGAENASAIIEAIKNKTVNNTDIAITLTENGHHLSEASVRRHARHNDSLFVPYNGPRHAGSIASQLAAFNKKSAITARILQIDIETSPSMAYVWGLWDENIPLDRLLIPGEVICFAAKWYGDNSDIMFFSDYHDGHDSMIFEAWKLYNEADIVVTYNGKNFDNKHLQREFILGGFVPPSPYKDIDLLSVVRQRFKFQSNKLDFVAEQLGLGKKVKHKGFQLWDDCIRGEGEVKAKAWADMKKYNLGDVVLQEKVYEKLLPWIKAHPTVIPVADSTLVCPRCASYNLRENGTSSTGLLTYPLLTCEDCGGSVKGTKSVGRTGNVRTV